jgi:hypothetical protein
VLDRPPDARRQAARSREARSRKRRKVGKLVVAIEISELALVEALLQSGRLSEAESASRLHLKTAIERVVEDFIGRWRT